MPSGRYSKRRLTRRSKLHGQIERLRQRIDNTPRDGWDRHKGYTMPGSRKNS